jgi:uncharacterized membrane protein YfcA
MSNARALLRILLIATAFLFVVFWGLALRRSDARRKGRDTARSEGAARIPAAWELFVGFVADFLDTLGIGSFATTTSLYRARRTIDDRLLPGTLNVGHALPTIAQALIYIGAIAIEPRTLVAMIAAAVAGALLGARIVAGWPRRRVRIGMGLALLVLCAILVKRQFADPTGGAALGLEGARLWVGAAMNFVLGALMMTGVGLYAPCLVLVALLGMNPAAAFPIMMGSCAFLMPAASVSFIRREAYAPRAALGLALGGVPAVLLAAFVVKSLPLYWLKWLVAVVAVYTAITLLVAARREGEERPA